MKILVLIALIFPMWLNAGTSTVDNGGELLALEFTRAGYQVYAALKQLPEREAILTKAELFRLETAIRTTRVDPMKGPLLDNSGRVVDARYNSMDKIIEIDQALWPQILKSPSVYRLVLHEYLRVLAINDNQYIVSARLEDGLINEILSGKIFYDPSNVVGQSVFEQIGDYISLSKLVTKKGFTAPYKGGACFFRGSNSPRSITAKLTTYDGGPLFESDFDIYFMMENGWSHRPHFSEVSKGKGSIDGRSGDLVFINEWGDYLLLWTIDKKGQVGRRCYFWQ